MEDKPLINRVANSKLKVIDLEDYYPKGNRIELDISVFLFQGVILKEKERNVFTGFSISVQDHHLF